MNIGIFAFGRAGCKIAEQFKRFERKTMSHVSEFILAADTSAAQLNELSRIDEDWHFLFGQNEFEGRGTRADLEPAVSAAKKSAGNIKRITNGLSKRDFDAFVVIGSLGGGTGAAGAPLCAQILSRQFKDTPVYGVGILPAKNEANIYTLNAARSVQSFSAETDNLFLFDNEHLGVSMPESNPNVADDADPADVFATVNQDIARCLHILFTADERKERAHLKGSTVDTEQVVKVLSAGGLSTMCYATETLPRAARPGIRGRIWELLEYFRVSHKQKKYDQRQAVESTSQNESLGEGTTDRDESPFGNLGSVPLFTNPSNGTVGTGPGADVQTETETALVLHESEIQTDSLPRVPLPDEPTAPGTGTNTATGDESASTADSGIGNDETDDEVAGERPSMDREWPHPAKLVPVTLDSNAAMMNIDPTRATRNLFLLAAPAQHLSQQTAITTAEWAEENTGAGFSTAKNYPVKHKKVAVLSICSGIGIPDRIREIQAEGAEIAQRALQKQNAQSDPKEFNIFENEQTVPPSL